MSKQRKSLMWGPKVFGYAVIPWFVFAVVSAFITFWYSTSPKSAFFIICALFVTSGLLFANRYRNVHFYPLSISIAIAHGVAILLGFYNYDTNEILASYYGFAREYANVVPSEPAVGFSDAGAIVFTAEATVDITRSVGYIHRGVNYCAAPILDRTDSKVAQYWATGLNCCTALSDFWCDSAKDFKAHSGAVVFDNKGWFKDSNRDYYVKAMEKAIAQFDLQTVEFPLFVRWTTQDNIYFLRDSYHSSAIYFFLGTIFVYAIISYVIAYAFVKNAPRRQSMMSVSGSASKLFSDV